ncbi:hypothetical protein L0663_14995 [Dyadobacter sp. CY107]|uniref:hypothetical protein n=1 Tax=Dyadobacter fanqingshengii TaxID=2906443 RepID=UPI001F2A9568|nr:hypothetical protein [Dyadobacter fanqingshengii]MCF2504698.1 hypothetical protein [Dyadobacter fanqingshengii]
MKKLLLILCLIGGHLLAQGQVPTEREVREKINSGRLGVNKEVSSSRNGEGNGALEGLLNYSRKMTPQLSMSQVRKGLADTAQVIYVTDNGRSGNFRYDPANRSADDSAMVLVVGNRRYVREADIIYPRFFGTKGDGETDDTKSLQRCLDYVKSNQTIDFQGYTYKFDNVRLNKPDVILRGGGAKLIGTLVIGDKQPKTYNCKISGFYFATSGDAIEIQNVRKLEISSNTFIGSDKSIHVVAGPSGTHVNAMVEINKNVFNDVNYCLFVARAPNSTWMVSSDFTFEGNVANNALVTAVYADGMDGLKYINNVIFTPSDANGRKLKKNHLRIDRESDWVIVANNNFFESGEESLYFENGKAVNVNGNNFAWSGQKGVYDVIALKGTRKDLIANISANIFDCFSGNVVSLSKEVSGSVGLIGNTVNYNNKLPKYYGKDSLGTFNHYAVLAGNPAVQVTENNSYSYGQAANFKIKKIGENIANISRDGGLLSSVASSIVNASEGSAFNVFKLSNEYMSGESFSGIVNVIAKGSGNLAMYQLMVIKGAKSLPCEVKLISSGGLTEGKNNNHPSFTFKESNGILQVVPVGKTSGKFTITAKSEGALVISEMDMP